MENEKNEVLITRTFNAPRELVFKAWTDPEYLKKWYAPNGCTIDYIKYDFREGGEMQTCVRNPEYGDCMCKGVFKEIKEPEKLVFTMHFCDEDGNFVDPAAVKMDVDWPAETITTVTLTEEGNRTKLTLHQTVNEMLAKQTGAYPSWLQMLDKLEHLVTT